MVEWIVSSSVLIAVLILLRFVLKGKISLRLQYALWAVVLVRLLVPVSFGDTAMSADPAQIYLDYVAKVYGKEIDGQGFIDGLTKDLQ